MSGKDFFFLLLTLMLISNPDFFFLSIVSKIINPMVSFCSTYIFFCPEYIYTQIVSWYIVNLYNCHHFLFAIRGRD